MTGRASRLTLALASSLTLSGAVGCTRDRPDPELEVTSCSGMPHDASCTLPSTLVGQTTAGTITLRNAGPGEPLLVFDVGTIDGLASPFTLSSDTCTGNPLSVNESCTLGVEFNSSVAGTFRDTFSFATNAASSAAVTIEVMGDAAAP